MYEEYKSKFDNQREKIEDLKSQLEKTGVFSFAKKKELKETISKELSELNMIQEPVDLKKAYYDMYK